MHIFKNQRYKTKKREQNHIIFRSNRITMDSTLHFISFLVFEIYTIL